jgi:cytochrome c
MCSFTRIWWTMLGILTSVTASAAAAGDPARGEKVFAACAACHSLEPGRHMTGPSLSGVWGRKAGTLSTFSRYSDALKRSDLVWNEASMDKWVENPTAFIPGSQMPFAGIDKPELRRDLIAYLKRASQETSAAHGPSKRGGMMGGQPQLHDLKKLPEAYRVTAIRYCGDSYFVSTEDGTTRAFWEPNLRFKTDSSELGPNPGHPAMLPGGMMGDRASVFFARPDEISAFIQTHC